MTDPIMYLTVAATALIAIAILSTTALAGWHGWLRLKREELAAGHSRDDSEPSNARTAGTRIEMADLKERIRKLEAIAAGVDL